MAVAVVLSLFIGFGIALPALADNDSRSSRSEDRDDEESSGAFLGNRTWTGQFCSGETFTIVYGVYEADVTIVEITGPSSRVKNREHGARVYFDELRGRVTITARNGDDGHRLKIDAKLGRCDGGGVTTTTATPVPPPPALSPDPTVAPPTTQPPLPPTTPAPTVPPTLPPTTPPAAQVKYLTYSTAAGQITVKLGDPPALEAWSTVSPGWAYFTEKDTPTQVRILFRNNTTDEKGELNVTLANGVPSASFKSDTGGTVTPAPPTQSTTPPAKTRPSG